jgi:phenylacetate-coenzyme A ligase PaaK-like adenylate-forming protein
MTTTTGESYEVLRQRHVEAFAARLAGEADKLTWPLEQLHGLRDIRLRALLRAAKQGSPWHAERLRSIDPDASRPPDLATIPTMTKADLMTHWDDIVTDRRLTLELVNDHLATVTNDGPAYLLGEHHVVASGGSSGMRGVFAWDFEGWLSFALVRERSSFWLDRHAGRTGESRRAWVAAAHASHPTAILARTFSGSPQLGVNRSFPVTLPLSDIVAGLNEFRPTYLFAYPSMLHLLSLEARTGRLRISPHELNAGAEPLLPEVRREIENAFGVAVINLYAAAEVGVIARSFPGSPGMHLNEDIAVCEPIDIGGLPVADGTPAAKLLVTNVVNRVLPLIRYELTDEVTFLAEPNPDPWTGRRIADVQGRLDDMFTYATGVVVHPHVFRSALGRRQGILDYQVRQLPRGADIAIRTTEPVNLQDLTGELVGVLTHLGLGHPEVSIRVVADFNRQAGTGKLRRFVPLS